MTTPPPNTHTPSVCSYVGLFQSYSPSRQDILFARKATKGIVEHDFVIKKIPFKMVDVGGQRSQRQKWFQCFDGITSILFMVSSSEYDQVPFPACVVTAAEPLSSHSL